MTKYPAWIISGLLAAAILALFPVPTFAASTNQQDDLKAKADALNKEGVSLYNQGDYQGAINRFESALAIYQEIGDQAWEGATLNNIGRAYDSLGQYEQALDYYQRALTVLQEIGDRAGEGQMLYQIGSIYQIWADYPQALDYYQQALAILQDVGDRATEGATLSNIGTVYDSVGQYQQAVDYYQQALAIAQEIGNRAREGTALNNIGGAYRRLGQYPQALDYLQQALAIAQEIGDRAGEGIALGNIGQVYENLGRYEQALEYDQRALLILQEVGDRAGEGTALSNIGVIYQSLAQDTQALNYYQQALAILKEIGDQVGEERTLNNIGAVYRHLGQYEQALDYYQQSLAISQEIGDRGGEETTLSNIGFVYHMMEHYQQALDYYQQSLAISQEISDRAGEGRTLNNIGFVYDVLEQYPQALEYYQQALAILRELDQRAWESATLNNIGYVYEQQDNYVEAISHYEQAVEVIESIQGEIKIEELKTSFLAEQVGNYQLLIGLLWNEGRFQEAFHYVERARARAFLDQLAGGAIDFRTGTDISLLEREQTLRNEITALHTQLFTLRNRPINELDTEAITAVEADLKTREADYTQLLTEIKLQSPEVAGLVSVDVASLADIQSLLDANTTLVEYFVTEDRVLAFIIKHNRFETASVDVSREELTQTITAFRDFASLDDPYPASLKQLYTWLISPLKDKLKTPVIGIIPHGILHYLPFAALTDGERYLGDEYSLFTLPSASVLRFIQEKRKPPVDTILALGNPTTSEPGLAPLDFAQQEVETITKIFGTQPLIGDSATESALRSQAGNAGIVHLAAHGQYNPDNPLFSVIFLAEDQHEDGRLEVHEIYGLDLTKATDLVVLSACQTDVGAVSAGDEVVGLTRAFLYSGTPTVIASLWNVDDEATRLLMEHFYTHLRAGMGKAQALQQAQSEVRTQYPHPYYWAAFVLTGDAGLHGQVESASPLVSNPISWTAGIGGLLLIGLCCLGLVTILVGGTMWWRRRKRVAL